MTTHSRSRSKGSFSLFSIDTLRSLSRAGSRAASRARHADTFDDLTRSPSSLSRCDPSAQLPPSPATGTADQSPHKTPTRQTKPETATSTCDVNKTFSSNISKRPRPFSWILLRTPAQALKKRSISVQLPKDVSSSTMGRSVISAPVLTSTTNAKVAEAEGVYCGELTQDTFYKSTWSSKLGWMKDNQTTADEARELADKSSKDETNAEKSHRRFQKMGDVLFGKLRKNDKEQVEDASSLNHKIARRRAETVNLCKEKIRDLTGNGRVRRKSINGGLDRHAAAEAPPLLKKPSHATFNLGEDNESHCGSLSRSFNSALEKLDIAATTNMSFLRSRTSLLNMRKESAALPVSVSPVPLKATDRDDHDQNGSSVSAFRSVMDGGIKRKDVRQYQYSPGKGYIPAPPFPGYPAGVNGLRMHSDTSAFAKSPEHTTQPRLDKAAPGQPLDIDDDLKEAPIFSPSMGDLSQYSNPNTPATKKTGGIPESTPTRTPMLKKSKSGLSLLGKAALNRRDENKSLKKSRSMTLHSFKKETPPPVTNMRESPYKPATPSPLRNEAKLGKRRSQRPGFTPRSPQDQAKRFGVIGVPSPGKPAGE